MRFTHWDSVRYVASVVAANERLVPGASDATSPQNLNLYTNFNVRAPQQCASTVLVLSRYWVLTQSLVFEQNWGGRMYVPGNPLSTSTDANFAYMSYDCEAHRWQLRFCLRVFDLWMCDVVNRVRVRSNAWGGHALDRRL
eukprot:SAG11_NODE_102_length_16709_cov_31.066093_8_plen_140_part_00